MTKKIGTTSVIVKQSICSFLNPLIGSGKTPLYSEKTNSRPNAPINVLVSALILKDFTNLTDEEIMEACEFDFRYQYALHTTSFEDQPVSERTLSRFRSRLAAYELTTGEDLLHQCFVEMADGLRQYMEISPTIKRMDSMMIESNIRKMGRLELLYTCLSNLVKELHRNGKIELLEQNLPSPILEI